jgi:hypothetical protein
MLVELKKVLGQELKWPLEEIFFKEFKDGTYGRNFEYLDRGSEAVPCACKCFWLKLSLVLCVGICQRVMIMLYQLPVGSAGTQRDIIFITLKWLGKCFCWHSGCPILYRMRLSIPYPSGNTLFSWELYVCFVQLIQDCKPGIKRDLPVSSICPLLCFFVFAFFKLMGSVRCQDLIGHWELCVVILLYILIKFTALQVGRLRVRFSMVSLEFFIDIILLATL